MAVTVFTHASEWPQDVDAMKKRAELLSQFIRDMMVAGVDYGTIAGTKGKRLLKPGAEKLCLLFRYSVEDPDLLERIEDFTGAQHAGEPLFAYLVRQRLTFQGQVIASQCGSCNSREVKYRYRSADRLCPNCQQPTIRRSKTAPRDNPKAEPGWYCYAKIGGCGANFAAAAAEIVAQTLGRQLNPDVAESANTILKMAQKRALIAATVLATATSSIFSGDDFKEHGEPRNTEDRGQKPEDRQPGASATGAGNAAALPRPSAPKTPIADTPSSVVAPPELKDVRRLLKTVGREESAAAHFAAPGKSRLEDLTRSELMNLWAAISAPAPQKKQPAPARAG